MILPKWCVHIRVVVLRFQKWKQIKQPMLRSSIQTDYADAITKNRLEGFGIFSVKKMVRAKLVYDWRNLIPFAIIL
jgi:hypothetical protein